MTAAGLQPVLLETRQVKAALPAMAVETNRRDARGIAQLLRMDTRHCAVAAHAMVSARASQVGAFFGLTPKRCQSCETDVTADLPRISAEGYNTGR